MSNKIYLDNSATTKIRKEALDKYVELSENLYGNPSSLHEMGYLAERELNFARTEILKTLDAKDSSIIFTASGSEANNLALIGRAMAKERFRKKGAKIITTAGEHASVSAPLEILEGFGFKVATVPTFGGKIDTDALKRELTQDVILVSMMMVNNETGALYDLKSAFSMVKRLCPDALTHADATQSYMKLKFSKKSIFADMITLSSHKIEGPKGVGALVIDNAVLKRRDLSPIIFGGGQEGGMRSGTENVPAIAAFAEAARLANLELGDAERYVRELREYLIKRISEDELLSGISMTLPEVAAPHILNITLPSIKSETMLHYLSSLGIYVSSGSACSSNSGHKSSALISYGRSESDADFSIRISLSKRNSKEDIDALTSALASGISKLARAR